MQIGNIIVGLLKNHIDTVNLPEILKSALKKLKNLFIQNKEKEEANPGEPETETPALVYINQGIFRKISF